MDTDDEEGWVQLDPQNRTEWNAFWQTLLSQFEEDEKPTYWGRTSTRTPKPLTRDHRRK